MYGNTNVPPGTGVIGGSLAVTGSTGLTAFVVVASFSAVVGVLLLIRARYLRAQAD